MGEPEDYDVEYDDDYPEGAIWCDRCQGSGIAECYCGGDFCICTNYGETECRRCDGKGHYVPTKAQIEFEQQMRDLMAAALKRADDPSRDEVSHVG